MQFPTRRSSKAAFFREGKHPNSRACFQKGGMYNNVDATVYLQRYCPAAIFNFLREAGSGSDADMLRTFNLGVGMALVVSRSTLGVTMKSLEQSLSRIRDRFDRSRRRPCSNERQHRMAVDSLSPGLQHIVHTGGVWPATVSAILLAMPAGNGHARDFPADCAPVRA